MFIFSSIACKCKYVICSLCFVLQTVLAQQDVLDIHTRNPHTSRCTSPGYQTGDPHTSRCTSPGYQTGDPHTSRCTSPGYQTGDPHTSRCTSPGYQTGDPHTSRCTSPGYQTGDANMCHIHTNNDDVDDRSQEHDIEKAYCMETNVSTQSIGTMAPPSGSNTNLTEALPGVSESHRNAIETITEAPPTVTLGNIHQGDCTFSDFSRGRFCLSAALMGVCTFQNMQNARSNDIDGVLANGDILYQKIVEMQTEQRGSFNYSFLLFSDLPKEIQTANEKLTIDLTDSDVLFGECLSNDTENLSLSQALEECFKTHNAALIIVGDLGFSVFLNTHGQFCYFDSHSRNSKGQQCGDGTAILMCFPSLHELQLQLFRLVRSLHCTRYELQPIQVHREDTAVVTLMNIPTCHVQSDDLQEHNTEELYNVEANAEDLDTEESSDVEVISEPTVKKARCNRCPDPMSSKTSANLHEPLCTSDVEDCNPIHVIQSSISQADRCFAQYNCKKLSLSNVLTSLTSLPKLNEMKTSDVNYVLLEGARLCDKTKVFPRNLERSIPHVLSGSNGKYSVQKMEAFEGYLKTGRSSRTRKGTCLLQGLCKAFTSSQMVVVSLGNYMLSAFRSCEGHYLVFNPNPCNENALPKENGKATVAVCLSLEEVAKLLEKVSNKLNKNLGCYKLISVTIDENPDGNTDISEGHSNDIGDESEPSEGDKQKERPSEGDKQKEMRKYMREYKTNKRQEPSAGDYNREYMRKRRSDLNCRERENDFIKKRRSDPQFEESEKIYERKRRKDPEVKQNEQEYIRQKRMHVEFKNMESQSKVQKYHSNSSLHRKELQRSKEKYNTCTKFREAVKSYSSSKYQVNLDFQKNVKQYSCRKYLENQDFQRSVKDYSHRRYQQDPSLKSVLIHQQKSKYHSDTKYRKNKKCKARLYYRKITGDPLRYKHLQLRKKRQYLRNIQSRRIRARQSQTEIERRRKNIEQVKMKFQSEIKEYPEYVCSVCHRLLFKKQVKKCSKAKYNTSPRKERLAEMCIDTELEQRCSETCELSCSSHRKSRQNLYICITCDRYLTSGKMPTEARANKLDILPVPQELQTLNILEKHLVSRMVPFMRLITLPKGGQKKLKGPCILVPSNLNETLDILPRCDTDTTQIIKLKMKRKLSYKGYYEYQQVNVNKIHDALTCLKHRVGNSHYADVQIHDANNMDTDLLENCGNQNDDSGTDTQSDRGNTINEQHVDVPECIDNNVQDNDRGNTEDDDIDNCQNDENRRGPALDTFLMPVDMVQEALPLCPDSILSIAPCEGNKPTNLFAEKACEALAFPNHFPNGKNTITEERPVKLSPSKYFQARLMNVDSRFARDPQYIFFGLYITELDFISSNIAISLRKGKKNTKDGKKITAKTLSERQGIDHVTGEDTGFRHFPTPKGSPEYWKRTLHDLFAMLRQIGLPTFFCSFSCNNDWPEITTAIKAQCGETVDVDNLTWEEKCSILASNPVTCARMFDHRVRCFIRDVIKSPANPIGKVTEYFYRTEWQARGSPHIHCLFWVKDAPLIGRENDVAVCDFINQYISCIIPEENDRIHEQVSRFQKHSKNHTKSCKKGNRPCRFNYPRPVAKRTFISRPIVESTGMLPTKAEMKSAQTKLSAVSDILNENPHDESISIDEVLEKAGLTWRTYKEAFDIATNKVSVVMKRDVKDCWTNNYNPALLDIWNANMDIQYITDAYSCVMYILSYVSKAEHELSDVLKDAQRELRDGNFDLKSEMRKLGNVYLDYREVSCQEAAHRMCNLHLKECTRSCVFLPTDEHATRMSLPLKQIEAKAKEDGNNDDIWCKNIVDKYQARPDGRDWDMMCLADFASQYWVVYGQTNADNKITLKDNCGTIQKRKPETFAIIRYPRHPETTKPEQYYQSQLKVYLPWRHLYQLKPGGYVTYEEFYQNGAVRMSEGEQIRTVKDIVMENKMRYEKDAKILDQAWETLQQAENLEDAWANVANQAEVSRLEAQEERMAFDENDDEPLTDNHDYLNDEPADSTPGTFSVDHSDDGCVSRTVKPLLKNMNEMQQKTFYTVRKWCLDKVNGLKPEPFKIFLSGSAGVGKSLLIKCIYYEATKIFLQHQNNQDLPPVFLSATTGIAAFNVDGFTIHSLLKIIKPRKGAYLPLTENVLNTMYATLLEMKILVIDEISMMGSQVLEYVHKRLEQVKHNKDLFGGMSILAVGDFYQLPPVKAGPPICVPNCCDLWMHNFKYVELTEIMRQKDDAEFAALLNRLRVKSKSESLSTVDTQILKNRIRKPEECPEDALFIYARNKEVDDHNEKMLTSKCTDISEILAVDVIRNRKTGRLEEKRASKSDRSDGLPGQLRIAVGARVMITKNVDTEHGITNGALGIVTAILPTRDGRLLPEAVCIKFDNEKVGRGLRQKNPNIPHGSIKITPYEERLEPVERERKGGIRKQFPLKLSWACTIHKVQGLTVDKIVISMKSMFSSGHAYVAFSRVTNIHGLYLLDFDEKKIYKDDRISTGLAFMPQLETNNPLDCVNEMFTVVHHNVEGLNQNVESLRKHFQMFTSHVLLLTETWLSRENDVSHLEHENFFLLCKSRRESYDIPSLASLNKGGVALYIRKDVPHGFFDVPVKNLEFISVVIYTQKLPRPLVVCVIYRPSRYATSLFCHALQELIVKMEDQLQDAAFIIMGDFNEDLMKGQCTILNVMTSNGYTQIIKQGTTLGNTLLDAVYVKNVDVQSSGVLQAHYSYHDPVYTQI